MLPTTSSKKRTFAARYFARSKSLVMREQSQSPGRLPEAHRLGPELKAGWLKKQRSIMKNWQLRWFVLRGDQLFYYKDKEESKPQGFISLQGTQVNELPPDSEDAGKHLFEICPGYTGEQKMPANHEAFLLMASSQSDMEDWVRAIRRVIWAPLGGGIFGQHLEDTVHHERKYGSHQAPLLVEQCVDFLREHGLTEEGLFRMPGQATLVRDLQDSFDCGEKPMFDSTTDVHTVASLLKLYLRELPEPVVPFARYEDFLSCAQLLTKDEGEAGIFEASVSLILKGTLELAKQVNHLPPANYNLLRYICKFLDEVQSHSDVNKMSVQNLATVFGPNILRPQVEDPVTLMEGTSLVQHLMTVLIQKHSQLFTTIGTARLASQHGDTQHTVGWGSVDVTRDSQGGLGGPSGPGLLSQRTSSLDGTAMGALSRAPAAGPAATSSGKKVQTLPNWRSSFQQSACEPDSPKASSLALQMPVFSYSGNWIMNGLSSPRGHCRASSEDWLQDAGSSQRLSTYDNVLPPSLLATSPSTASTAGSRASSSCEVLTKGSFSSCTACRASDSPACSSLHTECALEHSVLHSSNEERGSLDPGHNLDEEGTGSRSDPSSPGQDLACGPDALQALVKKLRAELFQQRMEYETSVRRIEAGSADLQKRMLQLEEELDQERKKYTMLEIKLRNTERARRDAERRNQLLQKEMEEFFSTLGSLTFGDRSAKAPQ
ncbi:rho GTPase-activating protein 22 isoform 2-T2 [Rhynchocyon petersi]